MTETPEDVVRDMAGETVCGFRVAAYRETHPEHGDKYGHRYSEHWSTPSSRDPRVKVERLFTEAQLREALARADSEGQLHDQWASTATKHKCLILRVGSALGMSPHWSETEIIERVEDRAANLTAASAALLSHLKFAVKLLSAFPAMSGMAQVEAMRAVVAEAESK